MGKNRLSISALRVAILYILFAGLWILFSDRVLITLVQDPVQLTFWQTIKGLLFIFVMAILLFIERSITENIARRREEATEQVSLLFEQIPNPIWVMDPSTQQFLEVNRAAEDLYGYTRAEFLRMSAHDVRSAPLQADAAERLAALQIGEVFDYVATHHCKGGRKLEIFAVGRRTQWNGRPAILSVLQDMTEYVRAQKNLSNISSELRATLNASPLAIYSLNLQGQVNTWNPAAERTFGWSAAEVIGKSLPFIISGQAAAFSDLQTTIIGGQTINAFQTRARRKDGREIDLEISAARLVNGEGRISGFMQIAADITQRLTAQRELHDTREVLAGLLENTPLPIYVLGEQLDMRLVNTAAEQILGSPRTAILNMPFKDLVNEPFVGHFIESNQQVLRTGEVLDEELWVTLHGQEFCYHTIKFPLHDLQGQVNAVGGLYIDITEQKRTLRELRHLNADLEKRVAERTQELAAKNTELETFTYSVSHDLKAPLRGISGYTNLLLEDYLDQLEPEAQRFLRNVSASTEQMSQLIDDLLSYSRLERRSLNLMSIPIQPLVERILATYHEEIERRQIDIAIELPFTHVLHDGESLYQALNNLVDNAFKFTRDVPAPRIEIGGSQTDATQCLWVKDNGPGFEPKYKEKVFEIFQRLYRAEEFAGTGIGLAIVRKSMERVGGRAWVESTPGQGAAFYLEIPREKARE